MSDTYVRITNTPIHYIDVTSVREPYAPPVPATFEIEVMVVKTDMPLEEAQRHAREGTVFRLIEVDDE